MEFAFDQDQLALKRAARRFLEANAPARPGRTLEAPADDPGLWDRMARELGWTALIIPERYGGAGCSPVWLAALMEELGRALVSSPLFATIALATNAILSGGTEEQRQELLPGIARGDVRATLAAAEGNGVLEPARLETNARAVRGDLVLSGKKTHVLDGHLADLLIVAARRDDRVELYAVPASAPGVSRRLEPTMDLTRARATVSFDAVKLPPASQLGSGGAGRAALERTLALAAIALAAEQVGGAERCLELAVEYAKARVQFGRPIGSFQAIKHKCADMLLRVESARSAAYYAAWFAAEGDGPLGVAADLASAYCSEAYVFAASENIQIHGGIGFTWEHDAHLHFKRAHASARLFGAPPEHRERIAAHLGL